MSNPSFPHFDSKIDHCPTCGMNRWLREEAVKHGNNPDEVAPEPEPLILPPVASAPIEAVAPASVPAEVAEPVTQPEMPAVEA